jgi:hypothetical protein
MAETERKSINPKLRKQVLERDNHICRKCSKNEKLCLHHIIPVADGEQIDTLENLITLCERCHQEWEVIVYRRTGGVTFEEWLEIPTALYQEETLDRRYDSSRSNGRHYSSIPNDQEHQRDRRERII